MPITLVSSLSNRKIVLITDYFQGGLWNIVLYHAQCLCHRKLLQKFIYFTTDKHPDLSFDCPIASIPFHQNYSNFGFFKDYYGKAKSLKSLLLREPHRAKRLTAIVSTDPWYLLVSFWFGYRRLFYLYQGNAYVPIKKIGDINYRQILLRFVQRIGFLLSTTIVPSEEARNLVRQETYGFSAAKVVVVPNGLDEAYFSNPKIESLQFAKFGTKKVILYSGRISRYKGLEGLLRVFLQLSRQRDDCVLALAYPTDADEELLRSLVEYVKTHRIHKHVYWLENVSQADLKLLYASSTVGVLNSESEFASLSVLESLAAGLPVVATKVGNNESVLNQVDSRLLIDVGNEKNLLAAISRVLAFSKVEKQKIGRLCQKVARTYTLNRSTRAMVNVFLSD